MFSILQALTLVLVTSAALPLDDDGHTDESRPYEFGFLIEGEQHRYEKKDEKGIIMGEFGFITADGVYHVTVYATDEDGNFRIVKTRNIRIGLATPKPPSTPSPALPRQPSPGGVTLAGLKGCSGCLIPSSTPLPGSGNQGSAFLYPRNKPGIGGYQEADKRQGPVYPQQQSVTGNQPSLSNPAPNRGFGQTNNGLGNTGGVLDKSSYNNKIPGTFGPKKSQDTPDYSRGNYVDSQQPFYKEGDSKTSVPIQSKPLTEAEIRMVEFMNKLYKFNYTLSFHGHEEEGDTEGRKKGSYFANGRDAFQRKVAYLANEFGYQPVVSSADLDASQTPNELTEKQLTQLLGSEFIWFYDKIKDGS